MAGDIQEFTFAANLLSAILWQYNDAETLQAIVNSKQEWFDENQQDFWNDFVTDIFDLRTANEFGLKVWSIILNLPLFVSTPPQPVTKPTWGFGVNNVNFGLGNFTTLNGGTVDLPLATKRLALQLRYFQLVSSGTVPEINRFLKYVFASYGRAFLVDNMDMTQTYVFEFPVTSDLQYLFNNFDILPRPSGVGSSYRDATQNSFGFGLNRLNFYNSNFGE